MAFYTTRQKVGCFLFDVLRLLPALLRRTGWQKAWNRNERPNVQHNGVDTTPLGQWSSDLYAALVFPWIGKRLMKQAFREWPVCMNPEPKKPAIQNDITFVIPYRGVSRLPQLTGTVCSIMAQEGVNVECIVVEQDQQRHVNGLPASVKVLHLPHSTDAQGWRKAWAFNKGVSKSTSDVVVCHDGDILVPKDYGREIMRYLGSGDYDVCFLQRFLFCLDRKDSILLTERCELSSGTIPARVRQNWQGGTVAIRKKSYWQIGGYDESFVDWGGEDNEFYDRCQLLRVFKHGYLPFVHLWHPAQQSKGNAIRNDNLEKMRRLLKIPAGQRVQSLTATSVRQRNRCGD